MINIYKRRKELNLTLEEIACFVGVSKSTVKKWEAGYIKNMRRDKIKKLATILDVCPLEFLSLDVPLQNSQLPVSFLNENLTEKLAAILAEAFDTKIEDTFALIIKDKKIFLANSQTNHLKYILDSIK